MSLLCPGAKKEKVSGPAEPSKAETLKVSTGTQTCLVDVDLAPEAKIFTLFCNGIPEMIRSRPDLCMHFNVKAY